MSDAGDDVEVQDSAPVEISAADVPKGKMSVEDALQVRPIDACSIHILTTKSCSKF